MLMYRALHGFVFYSVAVLPLSCNTDAGSQALVLSSRGGVRSPLHLATLRNNHIQIRHVPAASACLGGLHLLYDIHSVHNTTIDDMLAIKEGRRHSRDEELRAVRVGTGILRLSALRQQTGWRMGVGKRGRDRKYIQPWTTGLPGHALG